MKHRGFAARGFAAIMWLAALFTFGHYGSFTYGKQSKGKDYVKRAHTNFEPMNFPRHGSTWHNTFAQRERSPRKKRISPAQRNQTGSMRSYTKKREQNRALV